MLERSRACLLQSTIKHQIPTVSALGIPTDSVYLRVSADFANEGGLA